MDPPLSNSFSVSCNDVPEALFENETAVDHFSKFGIVTKITLQPKKNSCIIEYKTREDADKAILNAGAYDGFMFDVKLLKKRRPKPNDDPEWLPDSEVAAELAAMARNQPQVARLNRQQKMDLEVPSPISHTKKIVKKTGIKSVERKKTKSISKSTNILKPMPNVDKDGIIGLLSRPWESIDDKLKALDIRDKMLRKYSKSRHGALKGCCPDMCPEKERLLRELQRQVAVYELNSTNGLNPRLAVKEYSRSSADQEEPLPYELRPVEVLHRTLLYLLHNIVDLSEDPEESLGDWFHFMWDRLRAIRKDVAQQALCCEGSVSLVEACARFHAHCAARLITLPSSSFDQRLNTENLLKCLQSLKYMYNDLRNRNEAHACICEPEFRAYVILLNLHDANFMWEVQHLEPEIRSSPEVLFAIKIFTALDNNNYVRFFKLVSSTTYLNACILMRYFDDVRCRAVKRMIKAYSPRYVSYFPAYELMEMLCFEDLNSMENFLLRYDVQIHYNDADMPVVALDKNTFMNNDEAYTPERAIKFVEAKRECSLGEMIYGKQLPDYDFESYVPHSSFDENHFFKKSSVLAEDQNNILPENLAIEIKKMLDNTIITKSLFEPKGTNTTNLEAFSNYPDNNKKCNFVFAEPKAVDDPQFSSNLQQKANPLVNLKDNKFGNNLFSSAQPGNNIFGSNQIGSNKVSSDFNFKNPIPVNTSDYTQPNFGNVNKNLFGTNSQIGTSNNFFVSESDKKIPTASNNSAPKLFDNKSANIFFSQVQLNENVFGSNLFGNYDAEKEKEKEILREKELIKEKEKLAEAERMRKAEEERLEKVRKEKEIQEELKRKIEKQKADEIERKKELERKNSEKKEFEEFCEKHSNDVMSEIVDEYITEVCNDYVKKEYQTLGEINEFANDLLLELCTEISKEECEKRISIEVQLYDIRTRSIARSVIQKWKELVLRSRKRRSLLNNTPMWLFSQLPPSQSPNQSDILQRMRDFHSGKLTTFKIPTGTKIPTICVFDEVKKYLLKRSNSINKTSDVNWKIVIALPSYKECPLHSDLYKSWIESSFVNDNQECHDDYVIHLSENYWLKKFCLSVNQYCDSEARYNKSEIFTGMNGLIFYDTLDKPSLIISRLENLLAKNKKFNNMPIALVLTSLRDQETKSIEEYLTQRKNEKSISKFKIYICQKITDYSFSTNTKLALKWLALNFPPKPPIECDTLPSFLNQCIGNEMIYRFKLASHSSIREAFNNVETIINLYNEAVNKTVKIACNENLNHYPSFAYEFKKYVQKSLPYPRTYEYFPVDWNANAEKLKNTIMSFKMPQYIDKWPPTSWSTFQTSIKQYIKSLHWYDDNEGVFLKVLAMFIDTSTEDIESDEKQCLKFCWLDVMNVLIREKISLLKNTVEVFYINKEFEHFRTTPWWYKSAYTKNVSSFVEEVEMDFLENTMEDLGISFTKRQKFDDSLESIPDDEWISQTLGQFEDTIKEVSCKEVYEELEKSVAEISKKQAEIETLLKSFQDV